MIERLSSIVSDTDRLEHPTWSISSIGAVVWVMVCHLASILCHEELSELSWCLTILHDIIDYHDPTSLDPPNQAIIRRQLPIESVYCKVDWSIFIVHSNTVILHLDFEPVRLVVTWLVCRRRGRCCQLKWPPRHQSILLGLYYRRMWIFLVWTMSVVY